MGISVQIQSQNLSFSTFNSQSASTLNQPQVNFVFSDYQSIILLNLHMLNCTLSHRVADTKETVDPSAAVLSRGKCNLKAARLTQTEHLQRACSWEHIISHYSILARRVINLNFGERDVVQRLGSCQDGPAVF